MNTEQFVEFHRACGATCIRTANTYWLLKKEGVAVSLPTLEDAFPSRAEVKEVLMSGAKAVRFNTTGPWAPNATEFLLRTAPYTLEVIQQKSRNQVRRGLDRCEVRTPAESDMMDVAFDIKVQTFTRQGREDVVGERESWRRYVKVLLSTPDVMPFGAYAEGRMVAYCFVLVICGKLVLYHPFMDRQYSKFYPMNAMVFTAINQSRDRFGPLPVSYGFGSIWSIDSLDHFKLGMGFEAVPRLRITLFKGIYRLGINRAVSRVVNVLPGLRERVGHKYARLVEEKELGMKWWRDPTVPAGTSVADRPESGSA